jgi:hypothetical protein
VATTFRSRPVTLEAVQFDGTNLADVDALVAGCPGVGVFLDEDGRLAVREEGHADRIVAVGWWVSRTPEGQVTVHGRQAFEHLFEPA